MPDEGTSTPAELEHKIDDLEDENFLYDFKKEILWPVLRHLLGTIVIQLSGFGGLKVTEYFCPELIRPTLHIIDAIWIVAGIAILVCQGLGELSAYSVFSVQKAQERARLKKRRFQNQIDGGKAVITSPTRTDRSASSRSQIDVRNVDINGTNVPPADDPTVAKEDPTRGNDALSVQPANMIPPVDDGKVTESIRESFPANKDEDDGEQQRGQLNGGEQ